VTTAPDSVERAGRQTGDVTPAETAGPELIQEMWCELLRRRGRHWGRASSGSMSPMIDLGDRVLVESLTAGAPRFGDVVLFLRGGTFTVHRVVGRVRRKGSAARLLEKGDRNPAGEALCPEDVLGRVVVVEKPRGRLAPGAGWERGFQLALGLLGRAVHRLDGATQSSPGGLRRRAAERVLRLARRLAGLYVRLGIARGERTPDE